MPSADTVVFVAMKCGRLVMESTMTMTMLKLCVSEFHDEVDTDSLPASLRYGKQVEQADQLASEDLVLEAGLPGLGVLSDVS